MGSYDFYVWTAEDCKKELHSLLEEERLLGATLLVFANKQDLPGALTFQEIREVQTGCNILSWLGKDYGRPVHNLFYILQ